MNFIPGDLMWLKISNSISVDLSSYSLAIWTFSIIKRIMFIFHFDNFSNLKQIELFICCEKMLMIRPCFAVYVRLEILSATGLCSRYTIGVDIVKQSLVAVLGWESRKNSRALARLIASGASSLSPMGKFTEERWPRFSAHGNSTALAREKSSGKGRL